MKNYQDFSLHLEKLLFRVTLEAGRRREGERKEREEREISVDKEQ